MYARIKIGVQILLGDHFQGEEILFWRFLFEDKVVGEVADTQERLAPGVLVNKKVYRAFAQVFQIVIDDIVADQADVLPALFLKI